MKRLIVGIFIILTAGFAAYSLNQYWIHRFDGLIARQASIYRLDPDLVWSIIYEETYFSPWKTGKDGEIGLMQVTPAVGRDWAAETGMRQFERQMASEPFSLLRDPERNVQIGCWYLEKFYEQYRDTPDAEARMIAAYNAGPSRAAEWSRPGEDGKALSGEEFIQRISIPSTRAYVISILERYRKLKGTRSQSISTVRHSPLSKHTELVKDPAQFLETLTLLLQKERIHLDDFDVRDTGDGQNEVRFRFVTSLEAHRRLLKNLPQLGAELRTSTHERTD